MTPRQLRDILFNVENQQMTVEQLRHILFEVKEQDAEIKPHELQRLTGDKAKSLSM